MKSAGEMSAKGILHAEAGRKKFQLFRFPPAADLGLWIKHFWVVQWDLLGQEPYRQTILSHPNANLVFEPGNTRLYGVNKTVSSHWLHGKGKVLGIKFRPAGCFPLIKSPASQLTGQSVGIDEVFGPEARTWEHDILAMEDAEAMIELTERLIRECLPERDEHMELVNRMVETVIEDRGITMVEHMAQRFGISKRTIQRLFSTYVGVSPKWVIQRHRLHEAAEQIEYQATVDWTQLSLDLGYYDQSHFIKGFKAVLGLPPEEYVKTVRMLTLSPA